MTLRSLPLALAGTLALTLTGAVPAQAADTDPDRAAADRVVERRNGSAISHTSWSTYRDFKAGRRIRTKVSQGSLWLKNPRSRRVHGKRYHVGRWVSPWVSPGFDATALIPSWEAETSGKGFVRIQVRARRADGTRGTWDTVADWSKRNRARTRTTYSGQSDDLGRVNVDTWLAASSVSQWQLRITLHQQPNARRPLRVDRLGAVASAIAAGTPRTSRTGPAAGTVLAVPSYSQMTHAGHYPQWGNGGEAWCSPTSLAMVLAYHGIHPEPRGIAAGHADAVVDHTAKMVFDHGYDGTGNWAFNTAYAATLVGGDSYVTRMRDLREAETHIAAGVPLVVSIAFGRNELTGAPISASNGHLLVIAGFEADGDVVVNDPAGASNGAVRRVYDRAQFERLWLRASGGTAYVVRSS